MSTRRSPLALLVLVAAVALVWWAQSGDGPSASAPTGGSSTVVEPLPSGHLHLPRETTDPESGLPIVHLADLPAEARDTVRLIAAGGPFPYEEDGGTFGNYEALLPDEVTGYYREYTVDTPGSDDRGARRIVQGGHGELYWTDDHYSSFSSIRS